MVRIHSSRERRDVVDILTNALINDCTAKYVHVHRCKRLNITSARRFYSKDLGDKLKVLYLILKKDRYTFKRYLDIIMRSYKREVEATNGNS